MAEILNFTKAALDAIVLPQAGKRAEYSDSKQSCLRLRVSSSGVKTFCVLKRIKGGGMERVTLARYPEMTIEQARKKTAEIIGKMAEGNNPAEVRRALKAELSFRELFEEYAEQHGTKKRAWAADAQRYRDYLDHPLGRHKLSSITSQMVNGILSDMQRAGKANATINNTRALASSIFSKGIEWGRCNINPVSATKTRTKVSRDRFLQAHELPRFFAALAGETNATVRDYFHVSLLTGARRSNVLAMRWSEINFRQRIWRISRTKNGDPQNVTLTDEAINILMTRKKSAVSRSEFVFPGEGSSGHLVEPKKGWKRIFDRDELTQLRKMISESGGSFKSLRDKKTGKEIYESIDAQIERARAIAIGLGLSLEEARIPDLRIHDLRRTLGSWQAITGASLPIIGKSLNHKSQQATAIYARLDLDPVRASVEKATEAMLRAASAQDDPTLSGPQETDD